MSGKENNKSYLEKLSNKELDALYASLARGLCKGKPSKEMLEIEEIMTARYDEFHKDKK